MYALEQLLSHRITHAEHELTHLQLTEVKGELHARTTSPLQTLPRL
jgi:hypothetical protein